jgi:hypothetical protein
LHVSLIELNDGPKTPDATLTNCTAHGPFCTSCGGKMLVEKLVDETSTTTLPWMACPESAPTSLSAIFTTAALTGLSAIFTTSAPTGLAVIFTTSIFPPLFLYHWVNPAP